MRAPSVAITTHILDLARGMPAAGVPVTLERGTAGDRWDVVGRGVTDADGRLRTLTPHDASPAAGLYRLVFDTRAYLERHAGRAFFPTISVVFEIKAGESQYHVPLLLSPFGYSTYRGS
jgi:5-hydroxyisourate hydrolase